MMKRIHASKTLFHENPKAPVSGVARRHSPSCILFAVLLSLVLLSGCNMLKSEDVYDAIYYKANFIGAIGFDDYDGANTTVPAIALTGQWDLGYRYETDWGTYGNIQYITLTDTTNPANFYGSASGLDPAAEVFQLEVENLITGEDFEAGTGSWGGTGTATRIASSDLFGDYCMRLSANDGDTLVFTTVGTASFYTTKTYNVFFRYNSALSPALLDIDGFKQTLNRTAVGEKAYARYSLTPHTAIAPIFIFSPESGATLANVYVDNFRVGRYGNMVLRLKLTAAQTTPHLEQGTYSFSVWTRPVNPTLPLDSIPYNIDSFVITMAAAEGTGTLSTTSATYAYAAASGWRKYTATLEPGALTFDEGTTAPVLTLVLDFNASRPGIVLLAQPELRFHPDGL
jgi:hypothetical protein